MHEVRHPDRYLVRFAFADGLVVATVRRSGWPRDRIARLTEILRLACAAAPSTALIPANVREAAAWGPRDHGRAVAATAEAGGGPEAWVNLARHHRARLDRKAAAATAEKALALRPSSEMTFKRCVDILDWASAGPVRIAHAVRVWQHRYPESRDALRLGLIHDLRAQEPDAPARAESWLRDHPDDDTITEALAEAHIGRGDADAAAAVWERRAEPTTNSSTQAARLGRAAQARLRADHHSRLRSGRRVRAWGIALSFLPGVLLFAFVAWHGAQEAVRELEHDARAWEQAEGTTRNSEVDFERATEATGLAIGLRTEIQERADAGDAAAAFTMSEWLQRGEQGFEADPSRALTYLEIAAAQDHLQAMMRLAQRLDTGNGISADPRRALSLYERCAAKGSIRAASLAGFLYAEGQRVPKNMDLAIPLLQQAAAGGDIPATNRLAWTYERGDGTAPDVRRALSLYRVTAEKNNIYAQEGLVRLLSDVRSPHYDDEEAWTWAERGARGGSQALQLTLARRLMSGREATARDRAQAVHWIRDAHNKASPEGAYLWGRLHLIGWQVEPNPDVAAEAFQSEHAARHPPALRELAKMHAFGLSVHRDPRQAQALRDQFAASNPPPAMVKELDRLLAATTEPLADAPAGGKRPRRTLWQEPTIYPGDLRRRRVNGFARIQFSLDEQGFTRDVTVLEASHPEFGPAAIVAVRQWRFDPEWEHGIPQRGPTETTLRFAPNVPTTAEH